MPSKSHFTSDTPTCFAPTSQPKQLSRLNQLKQKDRNDRHHENYVRNQRRVADTADPELQERWFGAMKVALWEIDCATACIPDSGPTRFLDLGCCPGGFSSYILGKNEEATGVGISLPETDGGHPFLLEPEFSSRHQLLWADMTSFQLGTCHTQESKPLPWELQSRSFDIAILDGHVLRTNAGGKDLSRQSLLVAQLIIALQSIKIGGTIIIKLSKITKPFTARILYMLDALSTQLMTYKPFTIHATQDTFYAVAKGIRACGAPPGISSSKMLSLQYVKGNVLDELRKLYELVGKRSNQEWTHGDLDFVASREVMKAQYGSRLLQLSEEVLRTQADALEGLHKAQREM